MLSLIASSPLHSKWCAAVPVIGKNGTSMASVREASVVAMLPMSRKQLVWGCRGRGLWMMGCYVCRRWRREGCVCCLVCRRWWRRDLRLFDVGRAERTGRKVVFPFFFVFISFGISLRFVPFGDLTRSAFFASMTSEESTRQLSWKWCC